MNSKGTLPDGTKSCRPNLDPLRGDACGCGYRWQRIGCSTDLKCLSCCQTDRSDYLAMGGKR